MSIICPRCGKSSNEKEFIDAFCVDCHHVDIKTPTSLIFETCKRCEKIKFRGSWQGVSEKEFNNYIINKCRGDFFNAIYNNETCTITFFIKKSNKILKINKWIDVKFNKNMCPDCSKMSGGYYEAIIQLRGNEQRIAKLANMLERELKKTTFISKVDEKKEGTDIYIGSNASALELVKQLGYTYGISKKLFGLKEGKRTYRTTYVVRLE